jgi:8-oxo-dGTP pyrophosphatase MutT (NUDIX family)
MSFRFDSQFRTLAAERCRSFRRQSADDAALKRAAVAVTLVEGDRGEAAFILTERPATMRNHPSQYALPGGRLDEGETVAQAALREIDEEIGLRLPEHDVLGTLDDFITRSGYLITPIVVWAEKSTPLKLNTDEVAYAHRIPVEGFATKESISFVSIKESPRPVIRIRILDGTQLHAPTAAILYQFCELMTGREVRVSEFEQPLFAWR